MRSRYFATSVARPPPPPKGRSVWSGLPQSAMLTTTRSTLGCVTAACHVSRLFDNLYICRASSSRRRGRVGSVACTNGRGGGQRDSDRSFRRFVIAAALGVVCMPARRKGTRHRLRSAPRFSSTDGEAGSIEEALARGAKTRCAAELTDNQYVNGAKLAPLAMCVGIGLLIRFLLPAPAGLTTQAMSTLAIFAATVCGIVVEPLPAPAVAFCAVAIGCLTCTFTFQEGVAAFTDDVLWLVLIAFFFAKGFGKTGLGDRIALNIIRRVGTTTLGLAYGLNLAEGTIAAGMPSSAARAAGLFYPLVVSVAKATGSDPAKGTERRTGAFLLQSAFQATGNSSSLWLYGAAQNLLILRLASGIGYTMPSPFLTWLKASCVPALVAMGLAPLLMYWVFPPIVNCTPEAPAEARKKLAAMGSMSRAELILGGTLFGMLVLWAGASTFGVPPVTTAVLGLCLLLITGVISWEDCAGERAAWSTMTWFAILVSISSLLGKRGVVDWVAGGVSSMILCAGLSTVSAFALLLLLYIFSHFAFASQVAHVSALYVPFVATMVRTGTPPMAAIMSLAVASNVFGSLTPYASAQAPVYIAGGYVSQRDWYRLGFIFIIFNLAVWTIVGSVWWKLIGMY
eukprot:TRINITY_DN34868_c0_g1_i1.p1 TRINITY_DN34868_c0_g1~~TRINITY_DN34868_c0_g1_i1.p1  ORF type:complete len:625 (-),score=88.58 TRINITY_DN34868_c0_g1_i1:216-2090(-)